MWNHCKCWVSPISRYWKPGISCRLVPGLRGSMPKRRRPNSASATKENTPDPLTSKKAKVEEKVVVKGKEEEEIKGPNDGLIRCEWVSMVSAANAHLYIDYHDKHWGRPCYDDTELFEHLTLEGAQAGLSWVTVLKKRDAYKEAFLGFDIPSVAKFTDADVAKLLHPESQIIKHKKKVLSAVTNAQCALQIQQEFGSLSKYLWSFVPDGKPIKNKPKTLKEIPTTTPEAEAMSKDLKDRGFRFVGPTICYMFMQGTGMVNNHTTDCFLHEEIDEM